MIGYRRITEEELTTELFRDFTRHQVVNDCWRIEDGKWVVKADPFIDDWTPQEYEFLVECLKNTLRQGGFVYGAFSNGELKGFTSVEAGIFGGEHCYMDLSCIHVSEDMRGCGIGRKLFEADKLWARGRGAKKLYISAHSAVETQAFYKKMGCVEAKQYHREHVEREPYDCQLECEV